MKLGHGGKTLFEVQNSAGDIEMKPVCKQFDSITASIGLGTLLDMVYAYMVVIANFVARITFIYFASLIRFTTYSKQTSFIMVSVFLMQFFNSGLIFIFAP